MPSPPKPRLKRDKVREAVAAAAAGLAVAGDVSVTPILMICALIGEAVAGACCEPYDDVLLHMRRIPYLDAQNLNDEQSTRR